MLDIRLALMVGKSHVMLMNDWPVECSFPSRMTLNRILVNIYRSNSLLVRRGMNRSLIESNPHRILFSFGKVQQEGFLHRVIDIFPLSLPVAFVFRSKGDCLFEKNIESVASRMVNPPINSRKTIYSITINPAESLVFSSFA